MTANPKQSWRAVFPAVTTQFRADLSVDLQATGNVIEMLIADGVSGLVMCGTVGENLSLAPAEKRALRELASAVAKGRVPVIAGIAEYTAAFTAETARQAKSAGVDGLMVMPAMVYPTKPRETVAHFRTVASATDLPVMIYNNPPSYRTDVTPAMLAALAYIDTIIAFKESSGDTRRFVDLRTLAGDRFIPFCGLDDVVVESVALGAAGWVSGMSNVFLREGETLFRLARDGRLAEAMPLYDWFMPLLHLDARPDLVQCIKLCESIAGRGTDRVRPPRQPLDVNERAEVRRIEPALEGPIAGGAVHPTGAHVSDPAELKQHLGQEALRRGARFVIAKVSGVIPGAGEMVVSLEGDVPLAADRVVIATGAWSKTLAAGLGDKVPLDTERGYNITFAPGMLGLTRPVFYEGQGFVTTPLESGDRVGGAVEFAGLAASPNYARIDAILVKLKRFLPHLSARDGTRWMGFRPSIPDSLPVIGRARKSPHVIHAFGHGHYGLTQAAITAELVMALLGGRTPPIDLAPYSAQRF